MKNQLLNEFQLYRFALREQSTPEVIVVSHSTSLCGWTGLSAPSLVSR